MTDLKSGAADHDPGYKACTPSTQNAVLCSELDLEQVIYSIP